MPIDVEIAPGQVLQFPDDMPMEQIRRRAGRARVYFQQQGRMPGRITEDVAEATPAPEGRPIEQIVKDGLSLSKQVLSGGVDPTRLDRGEVLSMHIGLKDPKQREKIGLPKDPLLVKDLTPQQKQWLGMPRTPMEELRRGWESYAVTKPATETEPARRGPEPGTFTADVGRAAARAVTAGKEAFTRPLEQLPVAGRLYGISEEGKPEGPEWRRVMRRLPYETLGGVERVMAAPFEAALAGAHEDPKQQQILAATAQLPMMRRFPGMAPWETAGAKAAAGQAATEAMRLRPGEGLELKPGLVPPPGIEQLPSATGFRTRQTMQPIRQTGEAQQAFTGAEPSTALALRQPAPRRPAPGPMTMEGPQGFEVLRGARRTREQLPGRVGPQLALPEAPREAAVRPFEEPALTVSSGGPQAEPGLIEPRPPEPPLPTAAEVAGRRAGLWSREPQPSGLLDPFGRPLTETPPSPRPQARELIGGGRAERPLGFPPREPSGQVSGRPAAVRPTPEPAPAAPEAATGLEERMRAVATEGGGNYRGIQQNAQGQPTHLVFDEPVNGSTLYLELGQATPEAVRAKVVAKQEAYAKAAEAAAAPEPPAVTGKVTPTAGAPVRRIGQPPPEGEPPTPVRPQPEILGEREIKGPLGLAQDIQDARDLIRSNREYAAQLGAPAPKAPFIEKTPIGEQAMIGGTEARAIPTGKMRAPGGQKGLEGTMFEKPPTETQPQLGMGIEPPAALADLARTRAHYAGGRFLQSDASALPKAAKDEIDRWLVQTGNPLASQAGTQESRIAAAAREIAGPAPAAKAAQPELTPPPGAPPPTGRTRTQMPRKELGPTSVNLNDPDEVRQWITGEGGLKRGPETQGINVPFLFRGKGLAMDELAQMVADARGISANEAERQITHTLENYGRLREAKRRGEGLGATRPGAEGEPQFSMQGEQGFTVRPEAAEATVPAPYDRAIMPAEWNRMNPAERTEMLNYLDSVGKSNPALMAKLGALGLGAAASPLLLQGLRGQPQDKEGGMHPLIGRLLNTFKDVVQKLGQPPTSPLLTPEAERSSERRLGERVQEIGRLAQAAVPLLGGIMAAGRGGGGGLRPRPGEVPRVTGPGLTPPPTLASWRESIRPEPFRPEPPKGPPVPPPMPGVEPPATPGPFRGVSSTSVTGTALRGMRDMARSAYATILGRLEQFGPAGEEVSRLMQRVTNDTDMFYGKHIVPILTALKRLTSSEKANFVEVAEGRAEPMNQTVAGFHRDVYEPVFGTEGVVPKEATGRGVLTRAFGEDPRPFQARPQFFMHEFDPAFVREVLKPSSGVRRRAIEQLAEREGVDPGTAEVMIDDYFRSSITRQGNRVVYLEPDRFVGGLERARELNIDGYITDPEVAIAIRGWKVARRFAEIDHYGYNDAIIGESSRVMGRPPTGPTKPTGLIGQIQEQYGSAEATKAYQLFKYVVGTPVEESAMQSLANGVTTAEAFTKLPMAFIANATQPSLTALRTSLGATARGLMDSLIHPRTAVEDARQLGVIADMSIREMYQDLRGGYSNKLTDFVLRPFNMAEKWNRIVSANTGRYWAQNVDTWLHRGQREPFLRRELDRLNFSGEEINDIMGQHRLRPGDAERIAWGVVDQSQFIGSKARRPELFYAKWGEVPLGQLALQFKTFSINAGRLMHQTFVDELRHGDPRQILNTAAVLGVLFPLMGEAALDVRSLIRGKSRETTLDEPVARLLENFFAVAGFGVASDYVESVLKGGKDGGLAFLAGPAITDAARLSYHAAKTGVAIGGEPGDFIKASRDATRFLSRNVPFAGPRLSEALRSDSKAAQDAERTWQQRLGLDPAESRFRAVEKEEKQRKATQSQANDMAAAGRIQEAQDLIATWNALHEAKAGLSPIAIQRKRERETQTPEQRRLGRLSPAARARVLRQLQEVR